MKQSGLSPRALTNRANAAHSTGPKTPEGKYTSSHNALKTGLTGQTVLLPTDDLSAYTAHLDRLAARYQPATDEERLLTQSIAQIEWRLLRIPTLESGLWALGRKQFAETHADEPAMNRKVLIEAEVALAFSKQLANLALQESRLNRQHARETARLKQLQAERHVLRDAQLQEAARFYTHCSNTARPFPLKDLQAFGFEFSLADIQRCVARRQVRGEQAGWPSIQTHYLFSAMQAA